MINLVGKKQLSVKDRKYLEALLIKSKGALTSGEREHLIARRGYLKQEALDKFDIKLKKGDEVNETAGGTDDGNESNEGNGNDGAGDETGKYDDWKSKDLKKECKKREIEFVGNASNQVLIELLEADDRGELEEVE